MFLLLYRRKSCHGKAEQSVNRPLLFNCAIPGSRIRKGMLEKRIAPLLMETVRAVEAAAGAYR
jgi:hypothetical protein